MRLQRYPDGANAWTLFIWSRHPAWSLTWTHGLMLTRHRPESGQARFNIGHMPGHQAQWFVTLFGLSLCLTTQKAMVRK